MRPCAYPPASNSHHITDATSGRQAEEPLTFNRQVTGNETDSHGLQANTASRRITVTDQQDNSETAHLKKVNAELTRSLEKCRELVDDCRTKLAANSNEPMLFNNDDEEEEGSGRA